MRLLISGLIVRYEKIFYISLMKNKRKEFTGFQVKKLHIYCTYWKRCKCFVYSWQSNKGSSINTKMMKYYPYCFWNIMTYTPFIFDFQFRLVLLSWADILPEPKEKKIWGKSHSNVFWTPLILWKEKFHYFTINTIHKDVCT